MAEQTIWNEAREMGIYHAGQRVEIKSRPGIVDTVIAYDPYMVPPIVLASDPQPRYPEELTLISQPGLGFDWFNPLSRAMSAHKTASTRPAISSSHR